MRPNRQCSTLSTWGLKGGQLLKGNTFLSPGGYKFQGALRLYEQDKISAYFSLCRYKTSTQNDDDKQQTTTSWGSCGPKLTGQSNQPTILHSEEKKNSWPERDASSRLAQLLQDKSGC